MYIFNIIILAIVLFITILIIKDLLFEDRGKRINKLIPSPPTSLPIFGNLLQINVNDMPACLDLLYQQYGSIFRLRLGSVETVVVSGDAIDECFVKNKFKFQHRYIRLSRSFSKDLDILYSNGDYWHTLKNAVLSQITIRKLNSGRLKVNQYVLEMLNMVYKSDSTVVDNIPNHFRVFIMKLILDFVFGSNYKSNNNNNNNRDSSNNNSNNDNSNQKYQQQLQKEEEELVNKFINIIARLFRTASTFLYSDYTPLLLPLDFKLFNVAKSNIVSDFFYLKNYSKSILNRYEERLKESHKVVNHSSGITNNSNNINNTSSDSDSDNEINQLEKPLIEHCYDRYILGELKYESIMFVAVDFMVAGLDTTSNTLSYIIAALINNPDVQERLYNEIKSNSTQDTLSYGDHYKYPYTNAVIKESHRYFAVVPISEPVITTEDVEIQVNNKKYTIAKGTQVIKNIRSSHKSNEFWKDPHLFRPERFLNESQQQTYQFGSGIRKCIGYSFAESILFNSLVLLIKNFKFINPEINKPINENGTIGLAMQCKEFSAVLIKRV